MTEEEERESAHPVKARRYDEGGQDDTGWLRKMRNHPIIVSPEEEWMNAAAPETECWSDPELPSETGRDLRAPAGGRRYVTRSVAAAAFVPDESRAPTR